MEVLTGQRTVMGFDDMDAVGDDLDLFGANKKTEHQRERE